MQFLAGESPMKCDFCGRERAGAITLQANSCKCCFGTYRKVRRIQINEIDIAIEMLIKIKEREEQDEQ